MEDKNHPLISICVPVYGVEKYIERCAVSLFEQTYENIEYIFVNDQTKDKSWEILLGVIEKYPMRKSQVKLSTHDKNRGLAAVRNTAANLASGRFIIWVDSDDYVETNIVQRMVEAAINSNADIVTCNTVMHYPHTIKYLNSTNFSSPKDMCLQLLSRRVPVSLWARLIKKSLYVDYHIKAKEGINNGEDYQVIPKLAYYSRKIESISDLLYHYNCGNPASYTFNFNERRSNEVWQSVEVLSDFFKDKEEYSEALNIGKADICVRDKVASCRSSNRSYFYISSQRLSCLNFGSIKPLSIGLIIMAMIKWYWVGKIFVLCADIWKSLYAWFKVVSRLKKNG